MYQNIFITQRTNEEQSTVYIWDDKNGLILLPFKEFDYAYKRDVTGQSKYISIYGNRLKKVHNWSRTDTDLFESDVPRETRVLTDLYLDSDDVSTGHVVGFFDIEVSSVGGFANIEKADKEVLSIAFYNNVTDEYIMFLYDPDGRVQDQVKNNVNILRFDTEADLLRTFMAWYGEQKFTILTGWNITGFDITYLYRRLRVILSEEDANMLSPIGYVKWSDRRQRYQLAGVSLLDYLEMYKKFTYTARPNYRLGSIGMYEVNMNKVELDKNLDEIYASDIDQFIDYNLQDVKIVVALDKKMKLIELVRGICHAGHVQYEDYAWSSKFIEGTILTYLHRKDIICPNKPIDGQEQLQQQREDDEEGFSGAYVKVPTPGLYEWVYSLDLQSLYPSIIMSLNISPETKVGRIYNWDVNLHMKHEIDMYELTVNGQDSKLNRADLIEFLEKMNLALSSNGILYMNDKKGIIPEILDKWFKERVEYKQLMKKYVTEGDTEKADYYDRRQHVQKIFLNCFSPDTDVMTRNGIQNIKELKIGDELYSINPSTQQIEIKPVTRTYQYDYSGDMVIIKNAHVDYLVTPNHRFLTSVANHTRVGGYKKYDWELAGNITTRNRRKLPPKTNGFPGIYVDKFKLDDWCINNNIPIVIKHNKIKYDCAGSAKFQPAEYKMNDWLSFIGWYISEGSLYTSTPKTYASGYRRGTGYRITISQQISANRDKIKELFNSMKFVFGTTNYDFSMSSFLIYKFLEQECGKGSKNKRIPQWIFNLPPEQLKYLFESLMLGDGHSNGMMYTTKSLQLANDFVRLVHHIGGKNAYIQSHPTEHSGSNSCYKIQIGSKMGVTPVIKPREHIKKTQYSGKVYCVEVEDNHTLLCGRNGKFNWCGQSIYGVLGLPIFRFYDLDNATAVTTTGQDVIKTTAKIINSVYDNSVGKAPDRCIYIDTDSVYFPAHDQTKQGCIDEARSMERKLNEDYYPIMAKNMFFCNSHRFVIKGESIAQTALWIAKKRYGMLKVYDLETDKDIDKIVTKGLDIVRSSFPTLFGKFMAKTLEGILRKTPMEEMNKQVQEFHTSLPTMNYMDVSRNTSVQNLSKYDDKDSISMTVFKKGTPAHVKAAIAYNKFLLSKKLNKRHALIRDGDKIKWCFLKQNPYHLDTIAFKCYDDPKEVIELVEQYIDVETMF
jgi:DNA polymerase I